MWNTPTKEQLAKVPRLYANEEKQTALADIQIYLHFFIGGCDWFIAEYNGDDLFFGYANLNDDFNSEWGYVSFQELKEIKVKWLEVDCDLHWEVKPASEIEKIIRK